MSTYETRPRISTATIPSFNVTANAIRLVMVGYLSKLVYNEDEDGHLYWNIPSETQSGVLYQIDYYPADRTISCSCPAGWHGRPCKHFRLFQLQHKMGIVEAAS